MRNLLVFCLIFFAGEIIHAQTTIEFSGIKWNVRNGSGGPGPNSWSDSPNNVWVDAEGQLHLKIRKVGNTWYCSEVYAQKSFGYGEYRFYLVGNPETYDPEVVVGLFTYETDTREIDIEFSRWGNASLVDGWFTVQPVVAGNQQSFAPNLAGENSTHKFTWSSNSIFFQSYNGHYPTLPSIDSLIKEWNYTGNSNPPAGNEMLHINFWLFSGHVPVNQQAAELIIKAVSVPSVTSINESPPAEGIKISPNPVAEKFTIELPENMTNGTITVLNPAGQLILSQPITGRKSDVDISSFPNGIYFVKLTGNKVFEVQKIIKE